MSIAKRSLEEAMSEVNRELQVRRRCYGRWIQDGKLSSVEATDRVERLEKALDELEKLSLLRDGIDRSVSVEVRTEIPVDTALH